MYLEYLHLFYKCVCTYTYMSIYSHKNITRKLDRRGMKRKLGIARTTTYYLGAALGDFRP